MTNLTQPPMLNSRHHHQPWLCRLAAVMFLLHVNACENPNAAGNQKRMYYASGEFKQGHDDGMRDAEWALLDASGAWMWYWAKDDEYRRGYDQGWNDGRNKKKLLAQQNDHRRMSQQRSQEAPTRGQQEPVKQEREKPTDESGN